MTMNPSPKKVPNATKLPILIAAVAPTFKASLIDEPIALPERDPTVSVMPLTLNLASLLVGMYIISFVGLFTAYEIAVTIIMTMNVANNKFSGDGLVQ